MKMTTKELRKALKNEAKAYREKANRTNGKKSNAANQTATLLDLARFRLKELDKKSKEWRKQAEKVGEAWEENEGEVLTLRREFNNLQKQHEALKAHGHKPATNEQEQPQPPKPTLLDPGTA